MMKSRRTSPNAISSATAFHTRLSVGTEAFSAEDYARTLEVLEPLEASEKMIERGLILHTARMFERDKQMASVSFDGLETKYSYMLVCTQDQTEDVLAIIRLVHQL